MTRTSRLLYLYTMTRTSRLLYLYTMTRTSCLLYLYTHSDCRMTRTSCLLYLYTHSDCRMTRTSCLLYLYTHSDCRISFVDTFCCEIITFNLYCFIACTHVHLTDLGISLSTDSQRTLNGLWLVKIYPIDVLLCHDDELEGRRIAFIFYLASDWTTEDGGWWCMIDYSTYLLITVSWNVGCVIFFITNHINYRWCNHIYNCMLLLYIFKFANTCLQAPWICTVWMVSILVVWY